LGFAFRLNRTWLSYFRPKTAKGSTVDLRLGFDDLSLLCNRHYSARRDWNCVDRNSVFHSAVNYEVGLRHAALNRTDEMFTGAAAEILSLNDHLAGTVTDQSHTLFVMGIVMILAGPIIMFFGDRRLPVRGSSFFSKLDRRPRSDDGSLAGWPNRGLFGAGVLFAGVLVLLKALHAF